VSSATATIRPNRALAALARATDAVAGHVVVALAGVVAFQILATVALFVSVNTNGWLTYQGGDQIWLVTSGWLLGKGMIGYALTGHGWPMLLAPLTWITGSSSVQLLPLTTVLQVGVLAPIATLTVYDIGARLAGRLAGVWCAAAFAVAPFVAIPYFVQRYHDSWVDQFLPQALGLTQQADFPSVVAVLVSVAFTVRALRAAAYREAVLAGTFAGVALALKPANALFLGGPLVAFVLARRWAHLPLFAVALAPALLALTIWKARGLGEVPLFAQGEVTRLAAGFGDQPVMFSATSWLDRTVRLDPDTWRENMSNIREFTWSARVIQFLPLAGAVAVARRSVPAAGLLLTWLLGYVVVKGAADVATVESGSFWRLVMPALPAFVLLAAAVPLLVPTLVDRMGPRLAPDPGRRPGVRGTTAVVAFLAVVPLAVLLVASQPHVKANPDGGYESAEVVVDEIGVPEDPAVVSLSVRRAGGANVLRWTDSTSRADTFYRVYRSSLSRGFSDMVCEARGGDRCDLRDETLVTTRDHRFVDRDPPVDAVYRIGVAANWLDDETRGDVFAISPPVAPAGTAG
jgi:hypothetical protein